MFKKILVPIDGSETAWHALNQAIVLGEKFNFKERFYPEFEVGILKNIFNPFVSIYNLLSGNQKPELKDLSIAELEEAINKGFLE